MIRQTPAISIRLPQSTADGAPTLPAPLPVTVPTQQTTVKKQLQDKLKSAGTKQIVQGTLMFVHTVFSCEGGGGVVRGRGGGLEGEQGVGIARW